VDHAGPRSDPYCLHPVGDLPRASARGAIRDHAGIREYWQTKVVKEQANIQAELLSLYLDGPTAIAEWEARFDDLVKGHRKRMREVAILEFDGDRIASLREYWTSERLSS
jgi:ketosteroid isomerase-like protein